VKAPALKHDERREGRLPVREPSLARNSAESASNHPLMVISGVSSTTGLASPAPASVSTTGPIPL
jgi:hypothetical protein